MMILSNRRSFWKSISVILFVATGPLPSGKCESENRINNYEGYKVYELIKNTPKDLNFMDQMYKNASVYRLDFLRYNRLLHDAAQVMVPPQYQHSFESDLIKHEMQYRIFIDNVKRVLDHDRKLTLMGRRSQPLTTGTLNFNNYYRYNDMSAFLYNLAKRYPNTASVEVAGYSYEGRPIKIINIFTQSPNDKKPVIFIDAGIHAREWIAPASALYIIQELVVNAAKYKKLLDTFNFVIMPLVNPDGYEYTHTKDRLWRKTRKPYGQCRGTDGNRNFDFMWCTEGVSTNPCDDIYCGPTPFSEPETKAVKSIMDRLTGRCTMYLSLHAFGSYVLHPWGFKKLVPANIEALTDVGEAGATAIKRATGQVYSVGSSAILLYEAAGGSDDYAMAVKKVPFAYTLEVGSEEFSFDPPPSQIKNLVRETWIGIQAMINKVMEKYL